VVRICDDAKQIVFGTLDNAPVNDAANHTMSQNRYNFRYNFWVHTSGGSGIIAKVAIRVRTASIAES
jgi:hypothetical protein